MPEKRNPASASGGSVDSGETWVSERLVGRLRTSSYRSRHRGVSSPGCRTRRGGSLLMRDEVYAAGAEAVKSQITQRPPLTQPWSAAIAMQ